MGIWRRVQRPCRNVLASWRRGASNPSPRRDRAPFLAPGKKSLSMAWFLRRMQLVDAVTPVDHIADGHLQSASLFAPPPSSSYQATKRFLHAGTGRCVPGFRSLVYAISPWFSPMQTKARLATLSPLEIQAAFQVMMTENPRHGRFDTRMPFCGLQSGRLYVGRWIFPSIAPCSRVV
jgi:hypothetical protein